MPFCIKGFGGTCTITSIHHVTYTVTLRFFLLMKNLRVALGPIVVPTPARNSNCK